MTVDRLNRVEDGHRKQIESNRQQGVRAQWSADQVKFIHIDISKQIELSGFLPFQVTLSTVETYPGQCPG